MISILVTFVVLFGMIKVFERDRDDLDSFQVATVAIVPVLIVVLLRAGLALLLPIPVVVTLLPPIVLIAATFLLLYKNLEIPLGNSIAYTVAVVIVNETLAYFL